MQTIQAQIDQSVSERTSRDHNLKMLRKLKAPKGGPESETSLINFEMP